MVIWLTGLSGSGKSTIANSLEKALFENGIQTYSLDGDSVRGGLNKGLSFSKEDRQENLRRIAEVTKLFMDAGIVVVASFISPLKEDRDLIKSIVGKENFIEVFVNTSLEECERRDVKGLYKKARKGEIENFTGISAPYENPKNPDLEIKTEEMTIENAVNSINIYLKKKLEIL
jgi:adenylylsulfate kinase